MQIRYYNYMLRGYNIGLIQNEIDPPTKFYLKYHGGMYNWNLIEELARNLSPIERIKLGLEANDDILKKIPEKSYKLSLRL